MMPILKHLAESTVFAGVLALVIPWLRRRGTCSAAARHALWLVAFAKFAVPMSLLSMTGASLAALLPVHPAADGAVADLSRLLLRTGDNPTVFVVQPHSAVTLYPLSAWLIGSFILLGLWVRRLRQVLSGNAASDGEQRVLESAKQRLGISKRVRVAVSEESAEPLLLGIVRPTLVLPRYLSATLSEGELEAVMLHELAHLRRRDNLASCIAHMLCMTFWFHPLLWWMERELLLDCECACDEVVVGVLGRPRDYIAGLLKVCRFSFSDPVAGVSGIGWKLRERVGLIRSYSNRPLRLRIPRGWIGGFATVLILLPMTAGFLSRGAFAQTTQRRKGIEFVSANVSGNSAQSEQVLGALTTLLNPNETVFSGAGGAYDDWLNKDVALIITPAERAAFLALTSNAERDQFIAQFWERRNPTPGTEPNRFKEEHYRRIASANERFLTEVPGSQTDRGRTYVVLGPPDEIDSHPTKDREMWIYHRVSGTPDDLTIKFDISDRR